MARNANAGVAPRGRARDESAGSDGADRTESAGTDCTESTGAGVDGAADGGVVGSSTRERLLLAASGLFAERGYDRATVRDIAARAGVNQALLFRHFGSKQALFGEVVSRDGREQLRSTPPERLAETVLMSMLAPPPVRGSSEGAHRSLETLLRSVGAGDEVSAAVAGLGDDYSRALAGLSGADDSGVRGDLALAWLVGIGLMRVVVGKRPLADADPEAITGLVVDTLGHLLEGIAPPARGGGGRRDGDEGGGEDGG
ncbi:TetR/AcrR family transcriptional regulator [Streptomyces sp. NPDC015131]|uniref:TetR/AcrR family transcriptional regulator n=1 Tax=Streptomyces sp. NPDC015131 TaxID=3364941 RepID=UPI003701DF9A